MSVGGKIECRTGGRGLIKACFMFQMKGGVVMEVHISVPENKPLALLGCESDYQMCESG
jgi:hypothetical protein